MLWRVIILVFLGIVNIAVFGHMIWGPTGIIEYREVKDQYAALQRQLSELDMQNMSLSREIRLLETDDRYFEKMIRLRLHYVRPNEILYLFDKKAEDNSGVKP